jgi:ankyrin repeat protein
MKASFNGHTDVVELLLEAGADVTSRDKVNDIHVFLIIRLCDRR